MRGSLLLFVAASFVGPLAASAQDRDGDRLLDEVDLCPDVAEGRETLFPGDGCPDVDADGDRIVDDHDFCPGDRETVNGFEDPHLQRGQLSPTSCHWPSVTRKPRKRTRFSSGRVGEPGVQIV